MKEVKILAIGNSFSEDATHYLYQMATSMDVKLKVVNLCIGGCSLERHYRNLDLGEKTYSYQINGCKTDRLVSINEMLESEKWDYIVTQQASHDSGWICSYEPFLGKMIEIFRQKAPEVILCLQETWAYEIESSHGCFMRYGRDQQTMYQSLHHCYCTMAEKYNLKLIPSGTVIQQVRKLPEFDFGNGGISLCRDGFHMSFDYGRYLVACVWLRTLFGVDAEKIPYFPDSLNLTAEPEQVLLDVIKRAVNCAIPNT